jgi:hypothetical protein
MTIQTLRAKSYAEPAGAAIDQRTVNHEEMGTTETQSLH